ncbi:TPA: hypothetical protein UOA92_000343 [Stenotrophomonas maltophilia]|nr:hypothetical protein [Stenotrophomonas maltophilia]
MNDIEKRARDLLAAEYERSGYGGSAEGIRSGDDCAHDLEDASVRALIVALTPPEGYVLVPVELVAAIEDLTLIYEAGGDIDSKLSQVEGLIAARPEVP